MMQHYWFTAVTSLLWWKSLGQ